MSAKENISTDTAKKIYCPLCRAKVKQEADSKGFAWCDRHEGRITPDEAEYKIGRRDE